MSGAISESSDEPSDWQSLHGLWAIRSGYVHVGARWHRVYRDREPAFFWFTVIVFTMITPVGIVGLALWELGFFG